MASGGGVDTVGAADIDRYFDQIRAINRQYGILIDKLKLVKNKSSKVDEKMTLLNERQDIKNGFIDKKQAARANIGLLKVKAENLGVLKERELKDLQEEFRVLDTAFKELGVMHDREALFDGAHKTGSDDPSKMNNAELLGRAKEVEMKNTEDLKGALATALATKEVGMHTAAVLEADKEKINSINMGLDNVESELAISQKRLTVFMKRLYTDKIIIAFTFLIVCGIVGIIVYASLNPSQKIFNVPDAVIPPSIFSPTSSPAVTPA